MRLENRRDLVTMGEKAMKIERKDYTISGKASYKYDTMVIGLNKKLIFLGGNKSFTDYFNIVKMLFRKINTKRKDKVC